MARHFPWALLVPTLCAGLAAAQPEAPPAAVQQPGEAEVRFADGSVVRVQILQTSLDVQTRYGKLVIPVQEIRRIEMGLHLSEATQQRIEIALKQLGSKAYRERELAVKTLAGEGVPALPALLRASKSTDLEVARRAETAVEQIRSRSPEECRRLRSDDVIETAEFPVVGRITTAAVKAHSRYFGDIDLKLTELKQVRFRGALGDRDVVVDATQFGSAVGQWMDSGYDVPGTGRLKIRASGQVDLWPQTPGQYVTNPKGYTAGGAGANPLPGTLLGRIGESGNAFAIGESFEGRPGQKGRLYLHIVPSPWNNASAGSYRVQITASLLTAGGS